MIRESTPEVTIYTDGSASAGTKDGGAGIVVTIGDPSDPQATEVIKVRGAPYTSSFEEERAAMARACEWIRVNCQGEKITICTDSLSLCLAL